MSLVNFTILFRKDPKLCIPKVTNSRINSNSLFPFLGCYINRIVLFTVFIILKLPSVICPVFNKFYPKLVFNSKIYDNCRNWKFIDVCSELEHLGTSEMIKVFLVDMIKQEFKYSFLHWHHIHYISSVWTVHNRQPIMYLMNQEHWMEVI